MVLRKFVPDDHTQSPRVPRRRPRATVREMQERTSSAASDVARAAQTPGPDTLPAPESDHLTAGEGGEGAARGHQLVIPSALDDPPLLHHEDPVRFPHRAEAVGDHDTGDAQLLE